METKGLEMLNDYIDHLRSTGASKRTVTQYRHKIRQFEAWRAGRRPSEELLREYCRYMQEAGRRPRTVRVAFTALKSYRNYLVEVRGFRGLPDPGVVKLPRLDPPQREVPTADEMTRIWEAARSMPAHTERARWLRGRTMAVLALLAYCGLRRCEVIALRADDVKQDGDTWRVLVRRGKGSQTRWQPVNSAAVEILQEWLRIRAAWTEQRACETDALSPIDRRRKLSDRGLAALPTGLLERARVTRKGITPHGCRHQFITRIAKQHGLPTASRLAGHSSYQTTLAYLHTSPEEMVEAVESLVPVRASEPERVTLPELPSGSRQMVARGERRPLRRLVRAAR